MPDDEQSPAGLDTHLPHPARIYDYFLGGKNNFAVDRALAEQMLAMDPTMPRTAHANRAFLRRSVSFLAGEAGVRQFLDIGTGLPASDNTHEVAQRLAPDSRIVYVDNDPLVLVHARALLTSVRAGATAYLQADLRDPEKILHGAADTLDLSRPVAVLLHGVLHFLLDTDDPGQIIRTLVDAVPAGSYLSLSHMAADISPTTTRSMDEASTSSPVPIACRTNDEVARLLAGLEPVEPGLVTVSRWRPDPGADTALVPIWAAVARKP
ncbi:SAM-dependent methyltransferase [Frankia sp. CNm7]|uniref:SAM-dependent methyltransferase n=1 Tax=Frankia nepalensis TaxID=1836974 RepID=A0A937UPS1_9ACTN|nr:SAM-dependent methyltransferase [Frankia nepalensis]MBL7495689.1 SAM-dependent methyltransferase [Frankia nepalensis]MBL7511384.1 SAM-dependent methyltransferase [Frankia nepalensis]MBL7518152.1 SAM-dependent methyltransferase [Frankia nepalensis]MBL7631154.1 SAM-dependent methyltransferase [Frankia nepalensis]